MFRSPFKEIARGVDKGYLDIGVLLKAGVDQGIYRVYGHSHKDA